MAQAYSQDLRDRVIDAGTSARAAVERFGIGVATAIVWVRLAREGERTARRQGPAEALEARCKRWLPAGSNRGGA
jgi:transposase